MSSTMGSTIQRRRIQVQGIVQGVGFRPFVYGLATRWELAGFVLNDSQGVTIEVEGPVEALDSFQDALQYHAPPLARIDSIATEDIPPLRDSAFSITHSQQSAGRSALISPDTATCDDCLRELCDPSDRRYLYPFIICTNCGPRFTIVQDVPYDRDKTTMRVFPMCPACQAEYDDPLNRRFHAQPNACPVCGPQVRLIQWEGQPLTLDGIQGAAEQLAHGAILAIKGLGGYHLACDALNEEAVRRLRQRKHREAKPFALMIPDLETAHQLCLLNEAEETLLQSRHRPIVLLAQCPSCPIAPEVAPNCDTLGLMLPYTPLHHVLLRAFAQAIAQEHPGRPAALVMTSGNVSDEPITYRDDDARARLASIANGMLTHNRDIHMRCDDTVMRVAGGGEQFFRRSRGYAPEPIALSSELPMPLLACGGHLKNTFCLGKGRQAFLSHHIGDLENLETLTSFREGIEHFQRLFDITPEAIAYDLHPEYLATKYALDSDIPTKIGVQHHHAHIASVLAEHGLSEPVIGVAADGTGYGTDGAVWGCEILAADLVGFERLAHLAYVPLPGGEQAVHSPWRMAAAYLAQTYGDAFLGLDFPFVHRLDRAKWRALSQMIAKGINSPPTSSLGRLFDAVASLIGVRDEVIYEGQAAIELEMLAHSYETHSHHPPCHSERSEESVPGSPGILRFAQNDRGDDRPGDRADLIVQNHYPFSITEESPAKLDVSPMMRAIVQDMQRGLPARQIAYRFHLTIVELLVTGCHEARKTTGLNRVALSGGVFQNRLLLERLVQRLEASAFQVYINRRVPPNDGGLAPGQLAVAAATLYRERHG